MATRLQKIETGLPGLDRVLQNVRLSDSVVWQIADIQDYLYFVEPFVEKAISKGLNVVYFRFAEHPPLMEEREGLRIVPLDADKGFENFTVKAYEVIAKEGPGTHYIFDCISELQSLWSADFMMRNFFMAVCPSLKELQAVAYFSILRDKHSYASTRQIRETASIFLNVVRGRRRMYLHPLKVAHRHSSTLFLPHRFEDAEGKELIPLTDGISNSHYYELLGASGTSNDRRTLDNWDIFFMKAKSAMRHSEEKQEEIKEKLYRILIGRDAERERLFKEHFSIQDYLDINDRLIGSGSIGGKAAGMLISRKIIQKNRPDLFAHLEPHDSYYIGSNVFYTYLITNNWWKLWLEHKSNEGYFLAAKALKSQLSYGKFPDMVQEKFKIMLDHFGQNPIIVRSSSFLEDGFGNAFAGKYDSVFCVNQGTPEERYEEFVRAVKEVYESAMDESALVYRQKRGLDKSDEQMSILVQRVSGSMFEDFFMPGAAGVGYSSNSYVWNKDIDPSAGMIRLVAGLGTRAVDRVTDDHPRLASLDKPQLIPGSSGKFTQKKVDILDFIDNSLITVPLEEIAQKTPPWYRNLIVEHNREMEEFYREKGMPREVIHTTCASILKNETIVRVMRELLQTIEEYYHYPVDVEFTLNLCDDGYFLINLVQCRPLQAKGTGAHNIVVPTNVPEEKIFFKLFGAAMGGPISIPVDLVAIVDPKGYADLPFNSKFNVARGVEAINHYAKHHDMNMILLGPGRWGTASADLGVPVRFAQICNVSALFEMSFESSGLMPELSFGSHFFQDLVESNIFYGALFEQNCIEGTKSIYHPEVFDEMENIYENIPNALPSLLPLMRVYDTRGAGLQLTANSTSDTTLCYFQD